MPNLKDGFLDPSGAFPRTEYFGSSSLNKAAVGVKINELYYGGGAAGLDLELKDLIPSEYPLNQVQETTSGHVIELDDTPGNERVLIKHNTGAGVEMRTDGTIIISSTNNKVEVTGGDQKVIVEGNGQLVYNGNLNLKVAGDMNIEVGGNYNLVAGTKREIIDGPCISEINGNYQFNVNGNNSALVTGVVSYNYLSDYNIAVKGSQTNFVEESIAMRSGDNINMSAEDEFVASSDNMNLAANDLSAFGVTGTIGGDGIVFYGEGANFDAGVTAPTFHGDLDGTAKQSNATSSQNYGEAATSGSAFSYTDTATPTTVKPTQAILDDHLQNSERGIFQVLIDIGNVLKNGIDRTIANGNVSNKKLNVGQVRSKLKEPTHLNNAAFTNNAIANGKLSPKFKDPVSPKIARTVKSSPTATFGTTPIGGDPLTSERFIRGNNSDYKFFPNLSYEPSKNFIITPATKLSKGVTLSKFLGGYGDRITLNHIKDRTQRIQIARNLHVHAEAMQLISQNTGKFKDFRLIVAEGLYRRGANEFLTPGSVNNLREDGRAIVYELYNINGSVDLSMTYDLAVYWSDYFTFDKIILSYDTFNPNQRLHAQVILTIPTIPADYNVDYTRRVETHFNNQPQTVNELVEFTL